MLLEKTKKLFGVICLIALKLKTFLRHIFRSNLTCRMKQQSQTSVSWAKKNTFWAFFFVFPLQTGYFLGPNPKWLFSINTIRCYRTCNFTWHLPGQTPSDLILICAIKRRGGQWGGVITDPPHVFRCGYEITSHVWCVCLRIFFFPFFWSQDILIIFLPLAATTRAWISLAFLLATSANTTSPLSAAT